MAGCRQALRFGGGRPAGRLGSPILPEAIDAKLASGEFDTVTLVHNETSTGLMNPLQEIAKLKEKYPEVMFIVDSVSSMTAVPELRRPRYDVLLAGTQKAWALPRAWRCLSYPKPPCNVPLAVYHAAIILIFMSSKRTLKRT